MNFDLNEDQAMFADTVARFAGDGAVDARARVRSHPGGVDTARWREMTALGLLQVALDADAGGLGGDAVDCAVVAEAIGRGLLVEPWLECGYLPLRLLRGHPLAVGIAEGATFAAVGFAEPGRRYALDARTMLASDGTLNGTKAFVLGGGIADVLLVTAAAGEETALFAVDAVHVERCDYRVVDGGDAAELTLRHAPATRIAGADIPGAITDARLMATAEMVGLASRLLDETLVYVRQREQFGQAIGRFQAVQHRLVQCYATLEQMRSTLWRAALAPMDEARAGAVAGAKAYVSEGAMKIGQEAIQLHGGMGVTDELVVGHAHKRVMLLSKLFGDVASNLASYARAA